jgi:hypothetical protein
VTIHYNNESRAQRARRLILDSCEISEEAVGAKKNLIHRVIGDPGRKH